MNDSTSRDAVPRRHWLTSVQAQPVWFAVALLAIGIVALSATGETGREALRYQRDAVLDRHQYWRLLTGHLVHGSGQHVWLNLAGLGLIATLFRDTYALRHWCWIGLSSAAFIDLGLLWLMPQLHWYVGLSGVLHGWLAAGTVAWWRREDGRLAAMLSVVVLGKLAWEQWQGALPLSGDLDVIVNAHLYGALGGLLAGLLLLPRMPDLRPRRQS